MAVVTSCRFRKYVCSWRFEPDIPWWTRHSIRGNENGEIAWEATRNNSELMSKGFPNSQRLYPVGVAILRNFRPSLVPVEVTVDMPFCLDGSNSVTSIKPVI